MDKFVNFLYGAGAFIILLQGFLMGLLCGIPIFHCLNAWSNDITEYLFQLLFKTPRFKRTILILLSDFDDYEACYKQMIKFQKSFPKARFAFSANAGEFGGFITDDEKTAKRFKDYFKEKF